MALIQNGSKRCSRVKSRYYPSNNISNLVSTSFSLAKWVSYKKDDNPTHLC
jgi:hypothetical protein